MKKIAIVFVFGILILGCKILSGPKKDVPGIIVTLKLHPDEVTIKDKGGATQYLFFSLEQKCLLVSEKKEIFQAIQNHLPEKNSGNNVVLIEATSIEPLTYFQKDQLAEASKRLGVKLNDFKVYKIFNYSLTNSVSMQKKSDNFLSGY